MKIKIIDFKGKLPERAHYNDAGADVFAKLASPALIRPHETKKIPLGIGLELPDGFMANVYPRSGLSSRGINCQLPPIDSGYRGEIHAIVNNSSDEPFIVTNGDKIGQLVVVPIILCDFIKEINEEARGKNAFGSTDERRETYAPASKES